MVAVVEKLKKFGKNIAWSISIFLAYNAVSFVSGYFIFKFVETQYNRFVKPPYTDESNLKLILILFLIWFIIQNTVVYLFFSKVKSEYSDLINVSFVKLFFELSIATLAIFYIVIFEILDLSHTEKFFAPYFLFTINLTPVPFWIDYIFSSPKKD